jgi:hypothetical protein
MEMMKCIIMLALWMWICWTSRGRKLGGIIKQIAAMKKRLLNDSIPIEELSSAIEKDGRGTKKLCVEETESILLICSLLQAYVSRTVSKDQA